jgi:tRNA dimethylallyltransferase
MLNPIETSTSPQRLLWAKVPDPCSSAMKERMPLFLAGPTGVGKSAVALELAEVLGGEIVSVDSMQVYRGMDLGTGKPTDAERRRVRHHLIDVVELAQAFDAARFVSLAREAERTIQEHGKLPIFCGGTGLYFEAYLRGLSATPPANQELRAELAKLSLDELLEELKRSDSTAHRRIDRYNRRRVVRAVEIIRLSGKSLPRDSEAVDRSAGAHPLNPGSPNTFFALERGREDLSHRINERVARMFTDGLVAETELLLARGLAENQTAMQAIGYRQVVDLLGGIRSLEETIQLVQLKTRQYAKRQMTWFRNRSRAEWVPVAEEDDPPKVAKHLAARYLERASGITPGLQQG